MSYCGVPNWPPVWTQARKKGVKTLKGEVGILTNAHCNPLSSNMCFLVINHEGESYVGSLMFDNHPFCKLVEQLLISHLNRPIKEIGDVDVSHLV